MLDIKCVFCEQTFNVTTGDQLATFSYIQVANPVYPKKICAITGICDACQKSQQERVAS